MMIFFKKLLNATKERTKILCDWLSSDMEEVKGKLDLPFLITVGTGTLTISAFLYLLNFYDGFNIRYFSFYSFDDAFAVLYEKAVIILFVTLLTVVLLPVIIYPVGDGKRKKRLIPVYVLGSAGINFLVLLGYLTIPALLCGVISIISGFIVWLIMVKNINHAYWFLPLASLLMFLFSNLDQIEVLKQKLTFNVTLKDGTKPMIEKNKIIYHIGTTTKYLFLYNDSVKQISVFPIEDIKEISFSDRPTLIPSKK